MGRGVTIIAVISIPVRLCVCVCVCVSVSVSEREREREGEREREYSQFQCCLYRLLSRHFCLGTSGAVCCCDVHYTDSGVLLDHLPRFMQCSNSFVYIYIYMYVLVRAVDEYLIFVIAIFASAKNYLISAVFFLTALFRNYL